MFCTQNRLWNRTRFSLKPWNAHVYLNYDKFNGYIYMVSVYFFVIHLCICLPSLCRHHSPVAYYIMFKQFFWTQIFTSILLVFPLHVVSISQTECHMVPQLNTFTINSRNIIYKQHLSIVSVWQLLCCDFVSVEKQGDCIIALSQGSLTLIHY